MDDTGLKLNKQLQLTADLSLSELSRRIGISKLLVGIVCKEWKKKELF